MLYLEDYLECIEHLPHDLRDRFTEMRELDLTGKMAFCYDRSGVLFTQKRPSLYTFPPLPYPLCSLSLIVQNSLDRLDSDQQTFFTECKEKKEKEWRDAQFEKLKGEYGKILEEADDKVRLSPFLYQSAAERLFCLWH